jgi:hypothetical protein
MRRMLLAGDKSDGANVGGLEKTAFIMFDELLDHSCEQNESIAEATVDRDACESSFALLEVNVAGGISGKLHFWTEYIC